MRGWPASTSATSSTTTRPGYLYVLWLVGQVGILVGGIGDLIKVPPVLADLAIGWLVWSMVRELGARDRLALLAALVVVLNPISWFDSVVWGQVDSFGVVFLLLALRALWRDRPERAAIFTVIAAIIKPQLGILVPLVAVLTIRRAFWPVREPAGEPGGGATEPEAGSGILARVRRWETRTGNPLRILTTGAAGFLTAVALSAPFGLSVIEPSATAPFLSSGLIDQIVVAAGGYPYLTVNAYNIWAVVTGDTGSSLANAGLWVCDVALEPLGRCGAGVAQFGARAGDRRGLRAAAGDHRADPVARRPTSRSADHPRRAGRPVARLLRRPDARPRALRLPVLRDRRDPVRRLGPLAARLRRARRWRRSRTCTSS